MNTEIRPARAVAPGRIILRELEARGWSQQDLATIMGRPEQAISEIINAKKQITAETAQQLSRAFGTSVEFWLNLEMQYQLNKLSKLNQEHEIERRSRLYNLAPINEMVKRGWIKKPGTTEALEIEYRRFFQLPTIDTVPQLVTRLRISQDRGPEDRAIVAWVRRVQQLAEMQPIGKFDAVTLPGILDELLSLTKEEKMVGHVPDVLIEHGIHFISVPHLPKTFLDGAALWTDHNPIIALSLRYDRIDAFWFTLLHEFAHIVLNHEHLHIDQLFDHGSGTPDPVEQETNEQVINWLFPKNTMDHFIEMNKPRYSRNQIMHFADESHRHPGIIVGQLMFREEIKYSHLRDLLVKVSPLLEKWEDSPVAK